MRNLKKILALVLALVMSLSLMATAGAADFGDVKDDTQYKTAIDVLSGLGVFNGYKEDGTFRPDGKITRAETAAIIYRIVTGDVKDEQVKIYADYNNNFKDVDKNSWYAGYVNFCANAEYIKGYPDGTFKPNAEVEGYAALAMILRAIGYTANGGFTGSDWRVQTARVGEARRITKNITSGTLGANADRKTVAEILFQAILVNMVDHNVDNTFNGNQGYFEIEGKTLGKKTFGLEEVIGVVVANEYANLDTDQVLANDRTNLRVAEDDTWNLNYGTEITDIGESRRVFATHRTDVVAMYDNVEGVELNKVTETGAAVDITTTTKFNTVAEMASNAKTEFYTNFDLNTVGDRWCDQRLEFSVVLYGSQAEATFDRYRGINISEIAADPDENNAPSLWSVERGVIGADGTVTGWSKVNLTAGNEDYATADMPWTATVNNTAVNYAYRFTKIIFAGEYITDTDLVVLDSIFGTADNKNNNVLLQNRITGDVFVGTKSTATDTTLEERDLSNQISYKKFVDDYIKENTDDVNWNITYNGWWTKFVDNNKDGVCDYAFRTWSVLDEAIHTYTNRDGETVTEFVGFDDNTYNRADNARYTVRYMDGNTPAVGDKVIAAFIDNQWLVEPAKNENVTVSSYSWRNDEITTDKGPYKQSGIYNNTDMQELISNMDEKVEYIIYLDHFGYVRAYELPGGTTYALLTELYYTNGNQGNIVKDWPMTAELTIPTSDTEAETKEYNAVSGAGTFTAKQPWMRVANAVATYNYNNWLQPVLPNLGVDRMVNGTYYGPTTGTPAFAVTDGSSNDFIQNNAYVTFWNANRQLVRRIADNGMNGLAEFNYGEQTFNNLYKNSDDSYYNWDVDETASFTNVAIVNVSGDDANLYGAADLNLNTYGQIAQPARPYSRNYIQLSTADIAEDAVRYNIGGDATYRQANNYYVNAVHDTQYFIAYNGGVWYAKDYVNFPGLTNENNQIHAAYAVARNTNADIDGDPYWVADVIVYEVYSLANVKQTSVSLAYYTPTRTSGNVQEIETLNSKYGPQVTLQPKNLAWSADRGQWGRQWSGYGFYALYNDTEPVDNVMTAETISRIGINDYGKNNIHAGTIIREAYIEGAGQYIDVDMGGGKIAHIEITNKIYSITDKDALSDWRYDVYGNPTYSYQYTEAELLRYENENNSQVRRGDKVIWVGNAATNGTRSATSFVVDLGNGTTNRALVFDGMEILAATPTWLINRTWNSVTGEYDITAPDGTASQGEWQRIMWEQGNYVAPADTYTVELTGALTNVTGTGNLDNAIQSLTIGGKAATYKNNVWTVKVDQGKLSYDVDITLAPGYTVTGLTPATGSTTVSVATFTPSSNTNQTAKLNIVGDAKLNLAISFDSSTIVTGQDAALKAATISSLRTWVNDEISGSVVLPGDPGFINGTTDWTKIDADGGAADDVGSVVTTQVGTINALAGSPVETAVTQAQADTALLTAKQAVVNKLAGVAYWNVIRLIGSGFSVDTTPTITVTTNTYMNNADVRAAFLAAWTVMTGAGARVAVATTDAELETIITDIKTAYDTAMTDIILAMAAIRTANGNNVHTSDSAWNAAAYTAAGIGVSVSGNDATVNVDQGELATYIGTGSNANHLKSSAPSGTTVDGLDVTKCLFAGVQVTAPAGTNKVKVWKNANASGDPIEETLDAAGSDLITYGGAVVYNFYVAIATSADGSSNWQIRPAGTIPARTYSYQFFTADGVALTDVLTINISAQ